MSSVRRLADSDADAILALLARARAVPEGSWGLDWSEAHVRDECASGAGWVSVAADGALAAFVFVREVGRAGDEFHEREILLLATDPAFRRQGRMAELVRHILSLGSATSRLFLEVHAANTGAREFYERLGLRKVGERKGYYKDGGTAVLYGIEG